MKPLNEIRAEFEDEDGNVPTERLAEMNDRLGQLLMESKVGLSQVTAADQVALLEQWVTRSFVFIVDQIHEVLTEVRQLGYSVATALAGDQHDFGTPEQIMTEIDRERTAMHQAMQLSRLAGLYELVRSKTEKRIEVAR